MELKGGVKLDKVNALRVHPPENVQVVAGPDGLVRKVGVRHRSNITLLGVAVGPSCWHQGGRRVNLVTATTQMG